MDMPTIETYAADWWPFVFILLAGWLPTDFWRWMGVLSAGRFDETSAVAGLARTVATALVAAVIARLVLFPGGSLALVPLAGRGSALVAGFATYLLTGRRILAGVLAGEGVLLAAIALTA